MTRRAFFLLPAIAAAQIVDCGADRVCQAANSFAYQWDQWVRYLSTISPYSKDFREKEGNLWARQRSAYERLERVRSA